MAISTKDKHLKDIARAVGRGVMDFEMKDRPELMMGGAKVFISSVYFDMDKGELAYSVSNGRGDLLPSAHGTRLLSGLSPQNLLPVSRVAGEYAAMRRRRDENLSVVAARTRVLSRKSGLSL